MFKRLAAALVAAAALLALTAAPALADEKFLGKVAKIEQAGATAAVTLQDDAGKSVVLTVEDKITLDKFADKRIGVGDEIKAKYVVKGGKNVSTYFKKPGGC
ncbi:MAG: hypothetical protein IPO09_19325 [Anaeromyxobacter sp.]|nr:hypothetical protein [Anaeromyxobacter sp.]MBL0275968.1 hypothetical protein [Anaeromyxobacter sp.]